MISGSTLGAVLALATAVCWGISPVCFASAGRRVGSYPVALLRVALATGLLLSGLLVYRFAGQASLSMPSPAQWMWLALSGLVGLGVGDLLAYEALVTLGPRRATQMCTLAPVASVLLAWVWLGETFRPVTLLGIGVVLAATSYAVLVRSRTEEVSEEPGQVSPWGLFCAIGGAVLMGVGAVAARQAFRIGQSDPNLQLDPLLATAIRVGSAAVFLWLIAVARLEVVKIWRHMADPHVCGRVMLGTMFGPFGGMICYVSALKYLEAGLVSTLASASPLVLLPIVWLRYKARIGWDVVAACALAVAGVAIIQMRGM